VGGQKDVPNLFICLLESDWLWCAQVRKSDETCSIPKFQRSPLPAKWLLHEGAETSIVFKLLKRILKV
jgi:hypothetical protein